MALTRIFGRNVRRARQKKGMTIEALADAVGLSYSYMGELERGKRNPTLRVVENLAVVLETPPTALLAESRV
ncbi:MULTISPECIES: helix-turn-helix transcriptional regulator [Brevundimonas]|jgi:transcriptional regulator with XRE-family HTH domain|uniref:helix-turn-helix domain-containing protein n=1 Tax=Brevundimonas TaxID=41275 RepID=UPI000DB0A7D7|nr:MULTISPECIES: helix-turn-helix transcriptional regulator [Brevundimonas]MBJ7485302.1 helix-turn-helix transcriptional regulator [Brevundimonas sp.]PZU72487.1 MAG: XRE family transcriptional regulator [Brevundimonas sp.]HAF81451.1 XRE family transcriptional regulator [Brevundimonas sp.]